MREKTGRVESNLAYPADPIVAHDAVSCCGPELPLGDVPYAAIVYWIIASNDSSPFPSLLYRINQ